MNTGVGFRQRVYLLGILYLGMGLGADMGAAQAEVTDSWQLNTSANVTMNTFSSANLLDIQYEISLFMNASYLDKSGFGLGYIRQNQSLNSRSDIVNDIVYLGGWHSGYPESLPGRFIAYLDIYRGSESISGNGGSQAGMAGNNSMNKPTPAGSSDSFTDSLSVINPALVFNSHSKTYTLELAYARSSYDSSDSTVADLTVDQWAPAFALLFNDQYDRLQLRHFAIDLSNGDRTGGTTDTRANELKWTHWFAAGQGKLEYMQLIILQGDRLYAVDRDARKLYNLSDMQTGAYTLGAGWSLNPASRVYVYGGVEDYRDLEAGDDYTGLFIYLGISTQW